MYNIMYIYTIFTSAVYVVVNIPDVYVCSNIMSFKLTYFVVVVVVFSNLTNCHIYGRQ